MIDQIHRETGHPIRPICKVLCVPRSSYYHAATPTATAVKDQTTGARIEQIFRKHRRRYGYRRIYEDLVEEGLICGHTRVRRLMAERGLKAIQPRNYVPKTSDGKADKPSPNRLLNAAMPTAPDTVWAGDITFIPTESGWLYLAVVIDLCSRRIVGWSIADNLRAELVGKAFEQAVKSRRPRPGLIFHSDRGSQYGSKLFRSQLAKAGVLQSMSAKANPYDNAWTESFIGKLKAEMLQGGSFIDAKDAQTELFAYIESYYNTHRRHSSLGYKSPFQFEVLFHSKK
jgi:transposase InsO family protein